MSGYPAKDKIEELREVLRELKESDEELRELERRMNECRVNIPIAQERSATAMRKVYDLLRQMDCASTGNMGWENRFAVLLIGLGVSEPKQTLNDDE